MIVMNPPASAPVAVKRILFWHVHGSYATSLVQGPHTYYVPVLPDRGADGRGRARTWTWPANVVEISPDEARSLDVDLVIAQRPHELDELVETWLGRVPGRDVPLIYLEHNAPEGAINGGMRHPAADRADLTVVHVTHFNDLFWDCGSTPTRVIEHGIVDPGYRYTGELPHAVVAINEALRRWRVTGTDLLPRFSAALPLDIFGIDAASLGGEDRPQASLHVEMPRRRVYLHPMRWTSLGFTLLEAMYLGMPVVALATTETVEAVPAGCGVISTNVETLCAALRTYGDDPERAREDGVRARAYAIGRFGLGRFLDAWDALIGEVAT